MNAHIGFGDALPRAFPTTVDSYLTFHGSVRQEATGPEGLIVVWQMCYPVQHVLDAAASMASSATFQGFCCGQYLAAVTTTVVYGTANILIKFGINRDVALARQ